MSELTLEEFDKFDPLADHSPLSWQEARDKAINYAFLLRTHGNWAAGAGIAKTVISLYDRAMLEEWLPIETAPRNGSRFLANMHVEDDDHIDDYTVIASFQKTSGKFMINGYYVDDMNGVLTRWTRLPHVSNSGGYSSVLLGRITELEEALQQEQDRAQKAIQALREVQKIIEDQDGGISSSLLDIIADALGEKKDA